MKHWFVRWMENRAAEDAETAEYHRKALEEDTETARELLEAYKEFGGGEELLRDIKRYEQVSGFCKEFASLAEDMIRFGFEKSVFDYYDAKQALDSMNLGLRPTKARWTLARIGEVLEEKMESPCSPDDREKVRRIYKTVCDLLSTGLTEQAIAYYERKRLQNPELNLTETVSYEEWDSEQLLNSKWA